MSDAGKTAPDRIALRLVLPKQPDPHPPAGALPGPEHVAELSFLVRRYPRWTIWFGPATGSWWALPPRERDIGDFVEAADVERLVARLDAIQSEPPAYRDAASFLRLGAPPVRRVPLAVRPGDPAR